VQHGADVSSLVPHHPGKSMNVSPQHSARSNAHTDLRPILIVPYMWIGDFVRCHSVLKVVKAQFPALTQKYLEQARRTLMRAYDRGSRDPRLLAVIGLCEASCTSATLRTRQAAAPGKLWPGADHVAEVEGRLGAFPRRHSDTYRLFWRGPDRHPQ
jgi:hypothetical protein